MLNGLILISDFLISNLESSKYFIQQSSFTSFYTSTFGLTFTHIHTESTESTLGFTSCPRRACRLEQPGTEPPTWWPAQSNPKFWILVSSGNTHSYYSTHLLVQNEHFNTWLTFCINLWRILAAVQNSDSTFSPFTKHYKPHSPVHTITVFPFTNAVTEKRWGCIFKSKKLWLVDWIKPITRQWSFELIWMSQSKPVHERCIMLDYV